MARKDRKRDGKTIPESARRKSPLELQEEKEGTPEYAVVSMNDNLREVYKRARAWGVADNHDFILRRYELGEWILPVQDADERKDVFSYGVSPVQKLAVALNWDDSILYACVLLVRAFKREEIERISQLQTKRGRPISWSHVRSLISVERSLREELLRKTVEEDWTCAQLLQEVGNRCPTKSSNRGRKPSVPKDLAGVIRQQEEHADRLLNRAKLWEGEGSLTNRYLQLSPDERTEELAEKLRLHRDRMWQLAGEAEAKAKEAADVYERCVQSRGKRKEQEARAGAASDAEDAGEVTVEEADTAEEEGALCAAGT